jgi:hypothetical protein
MALNEAGTAARDRAGVLRAATILLASLVAACAPDPAPPRPSEEFAALATDGAWCWFGDPRGVRFEGAHDAIYTGWVDSEGSIVVSSLDLDTDVRIQRTVESEFNRDDHANPSLMVLPDGRVVVFYTSHGSDVRDGMFYRISLQPEDISGWTEVREIGSNTEGPRGHTYPNPVRLSEEGERIYLFWRGGNFKPSFSFTDDLLTWSPARTLIQSDENTTVRPYVKIASNGRDAIHFAFTDGHPRNELQNSIYYMRYGAGEFRRADGSPVGSMDDLPLIHERADLVYDGGSTGVRAWIWDVAADAEGNPIIVYTRLPDELDHRYHYARWDGTEWVDHEITVAGGWFPDTPMDVVEPEPHYSGGIVLDHGDPSVVYLSRPVSGVFEIERWWTGDGGATWNSAPVTAGSANDNVRPFVIRNHDGSSPTVLWMENRFYRHYLDYDTAIRMDRAP